MTVLDQQSPMIASDQWTNLSCDVYECRVWLCPEEDGGYSAIVPLLPGVASQGETQAEALENIKEAFQGVAAEYISCGDKLPWQNDVGQQKPNNVIEKWILVNV